MRGGSIGAGEKSEGSSPP